MTGDLHGRIREVLNEDGDFIGCPSVTAGRIVGLIGDRVDVWRIAATRNGIDAAEARATITRLRNELGSLAAETTAWMERHNPECECEVGPATLEVVARVLASLDAEPGVPTDSPQGRPA